MIYRILVDSRRHLAAPRRRPGYGITAELLALISREAGGYDVQSRLFSGPRQVFPDFPALLAALSDALGRKRFARVLPHVGAIKADTFENWHRSTTPWPDPRDGSLVGASHGWLAYVMFDRGLVVPSTKNERLRYYFTECGWCDVGRHVAAEAHRLGHSIRIVRQKNPAASQVGYRDEFQVAILPHKRTAGAAGRWQDRSQDLWGTNSGLRSNLPVRFDYGT